MFPIPSRRSASGTLLSGLQLRSVPSHDRSSSSINPMMVSATNVAPAGPSPSAGAKEPLAASLPITSASVRK